jgi:hypothetical protein
LPVPGIDKVEISMCANTMVFYYFSKISLDFA